MSRPTIVQKFRETLGRALRETGQWLDRAGIQGAQLAVSKNTVGDDPVLFQDHLSRHRHQMPLLKRGRPFVSEHAAFVAPCATLIGSVRIGAGSSVFYKAILRADNCENAASFHAENEGAEWELDPNRFARENSLSIGGGIFIGENTNVQDGCLISSNKDHTKIGNGVTIGHLASIHSATVHDNSLIGMGSLLQEGVVVGEESFVAAGAVVARNTIIPSGELWVGNPARKLRDLSAEERQKLHYQANEVSKSKKGVGLCSFLFACLVLTMRLFSCG
jgi:carbonic anhydrase/acetyltransferase-like protein (isoleucine patch superfamily)